MDQTKTCRYIISLIRALLNETQPEEKPDDISFEDVYSMAKKHHVRNMCFYALEKPGVKIPRELYEKWKKHVIISEAQSAVQLSERSSVITAFMDAGIDCMPLKGCFLKEMYPKPEYREMADLDILVRSDSFEQVAQVMERLGYKLTNHEEYSIHDVYSKPPFMTVEIHRQLLPEDFKEQNSLNAESLPIMTDPWKYVLETEKPHVYKLTPEDTYIFLILHLAKHYNVSGIGIRQFSDIWLYGKKHSLDKEYIYQTLSQAGMDGFCKKTENLLRVWYEDMEMTGELEEMESYVFSSGVYGNTTNKVVNKLKVFQDSNPSKHSSAGYIWYRMFPSMDFMKSHYSYVKKYPVLLPVGWAHRLFIKTFEKESPAIRELRAFMRLIKKQKK